MDDRVTVHLTCQCSHPYHLVRIDYDPDDNEIFFVAYLRPHSNFLYRVKNAFYYLFRSQRTDFCDVILTEDSIAEFSKLLAYRKVKTKLSAQK